MNEKKLTKKQTDGEDRYAFGLFASLSLSKARFVPSPLQRLLFFEPPVVLRD